MLAKHIQRAGQRPTALADDRQGRRLAAGADHRDARLDDARLFPGNGLDGVAQILLVVAADVGDDRDQRRENSDLAT